MHTVLWKIFLEIKVIFNKQVQLQTQFDKNVQLNQTLVQVMTIVFTFTWCILQEQHHGEEICSRHFKVWKFTTF